MHIEIVETMRRDSTTRLPDVQDAVIIRALQSFHDTLRSDNSIFSVDDPGIVSTASNPAAVAHYSGQCVVTFRDDQLKSNREMHFRIVEKLVELLEEAGSAEVLLAKLCLISTENKRFGLWIYLEASGHSSQQAALRWGLGLAHLQQALLFLSRYFRQQVLPKIV